MQKKIRMQKGRRKDVMKKKGYKLAPVIVILALLAVWELVVRLAGIPLYVLPAPSDTISAFAVELPVLL